MRKHMEKQFKVFLREGYIDVTPSGHESTVYDYAKRVERVLMWEGVSRNELLNEILQIVQKYDIGGEKEYIGKNLIVHIRDFVLV